MKIRIINCEDPDIWYANYINYEFDVAEASKTRLVVCDESHLGQEIFKLDCELLDEPTGEHKHYTGEIKLIYIACALTAPTEFETQLNVVAARQAGYQIAKLGFYPIMPTVNTSGFEAANTKEFWYKATAELLNRCDAVYVVDGWHDSTGVKGEIDEAKRLGMPVYYLMQKLVDSFVNKD